MNLRVAICFQYNVFMVTEEGPSDYAIQIRGLTERIQQTNRSLESDELKRSLQTFMSTVIAVYQQCGGRCKRILDISLDFDKLKFDHTSGSIDLPEGSTSVHLVGTHADGHTDRRIWNSFIISREADDGKSVYGGKMDTFLAGQKTNGVWELIGKFEDQLEEKPKERIMRIIQDRWKNDDAWNGELKAQIAAEEVLTRTWINNPSEYGDFVNEAIEALSHAEIKHKVSPIDNIERVKELSAYKLAKAVLAIYFQRHDDGIEQAIQNTVFRDGTGFYAYDLVYDPIEKLKGEMGYKKVIDISPTDIDRFGGSDTVPELESGE